MPRAIGWILRLLLLALALYYFREYALVIGLLFVGIVLLLLFGLPWLAKENTLVTSVEEGSVKAIMRGETLDHFIMSFADYHINDPRFRNGRGHPDWFRTDIPEWEILYHGKGNPYGFGAPLGDGKFAGLPNSHFETRRGLFGALLRYLGLYWVGFPWAMSVHVYQFQWNETATNNEGKEVVKARSESTEIIKVSDFPYAIVTAGAETKDMLPTDEMSIATVAIRNPYRAFFSGEDWMRRVTAAINRHVRDFVGSMDYEDLIGLKAKTEGLTPEQLKELDERFSKPIIKLNEELPDDEENADPRGLKGRYGVIIRTVDLQQIDLSGSGKDKHQEAAVKKFTARQDAEAIRIKGKSEADVIRMKGQAEAEALEKRLEVIRQNGAAGQQLAQLDAMKEASQGAGNTVIWANNPFVPITDVITRRGSRGSGRSKKSQPKGDADDKSGSA